MAVKTIKHRAACHLALFGVALQCVAEQGSAAWQNTEAVKIFALRRQRSRNLAEKYHPGY